MPHIYLQKITVKKMIVRKLYLTRIKPRIKMALMDIPPDKYVRILSLCTVTMWKMGKISNFWFVSYIYIKKKKRSQISNNMKHAKKYAYRLHRAWIYRE